MIGWQQSGLPPLLLLPPHSCPVMLRNFICHLRMPQKLCQTYYRTRMANKPGISMKYPTLVKYPGIIAEETCDQEAMSLQGGLKDYHM